MADARIEVLMQRIEALEGTLEVQRLIGEYMRRCDVVDSSAPPDRETAADLVAELFTADAIWEGIGRSQQEFGRTEGRDALRARFTPPGPPKFVHNFHYLTTPRIVVRGSTASGQWTLLCAVTRTGQPAV